MSAARSAVSLSSRRASLFMQSGAVGERDFRGAANADSARAIFSRKGLAGEGREAAQQNSGGGIDGLDGHGLTQRQAYQERRVRGEDRPLRANRALNARSQNRDACSSLGSSFVRFFVPPSPAIPPWR